MSISENTTRTINLLNIIKELAGVAAQSLEASVSSTGKRAHDADQPDATNRAAKAMKALFEDAEADDDDAAIFQAIRKSGANYGGDDDDDDEDVHHVDAAPVGRKKKQKAPIPQADIDAWTERAAARAELTPDQIAALGAAVAAKTEEIKAANPDPRNLVAECERAVKSIIPYEGHVSAGFTEHDTNPARYTPKVVEIVHRAASYISICRPDLLVGPPRLTGRVGVFFSAAAKFFPGTTHPSPLVYAFEPVDATSPSADHASIVSELANILLFIDSQIGKPRPAAKSDPADAPQIEDEQQ